MLHLVNILFSLKANCNILGTAQHLCCVLVTFYLISNKDSLTKT